MKTKSKKILSIALAAALVFGLFAAMPVAVYAEDGPALATKINGFNHNGSGTLNATLSGNTVTVEGTVTGATAVLTLNIDSGVRVLWQAAYSGAIDGLFSSLINLTGTGTFEVGSGGSLVNNGTGPTIIAEGVNSRVRVGGGTVEARTGGTAVFAYGAGATVTVDGGLVRAANGYGISAQGANSSVAMNGGEVIVTDGGYAIYANGPSSTITITGGEVNATTGAGAGAAGADSSVTMTAGKINVTAGVGIGAMGDRAAVRVSGGTVHATTGIGIGASGKDSAVTVSGGTVSATKAAAIAVSGTGAKVTVNGGFVFAFGAAIAGEGNVINITNGSAPTIGGSAVVCAWNRPDSGTPTYTEGTADDLTVSPANATATWGKSGSQNGISYANVANTGFFQISGINVNSASSFTVTFNSNGGSAVGSQSVNTGYKATKPADPTKEGAVFAGWYTDAALTTAYNFDAPVTANLTLYAKWAVAGGPSMSNFKKKITYAPGTFTDVNENAWYGYHQQKVIATANEFGLMQGNSNTIFNPTGDIKISEAITIAARVHKIYTTGADDFVQAGSPWYQVYVDYAINNGIITASAFSNYDKAATRAEMAFIFSRALPAAEFASKNTVNSLPDVNAATPYRDAILMLYRAGILVGSDDKGTFKPGDPITRAEAAAIITRVILPGERFAGKTFN